MTENCVMRFQIAVPQCVRCMECSEVLPKIHSMIILESPNILISVMSNCLAQYKIVQATTISEKLLVK